MERGHGKGTVKVDRARAGRAEEREVKFCNFFVVESRKHPGAGVMPV